MLVVVGLSHRSAPLAVRERLAIARDAVGEVLAKLTAHAAVGEAVLLSTCNRVEVYAAPRRDFDVHSAAHAVAGMLSELGGQEAASHLGSRAGDGAVVHLFRVASSLDSLVVGEPQILGQLKDAIEIAKEARCLGATLGAAMHRAVRVGKRVRTETAIGAGQVSVSSVAVDLARQIFGELRGRHALLVGAGEMAEAAAKLVARAGARICVLNRSAERAAELAREVGGEPRLLSDLAGCLTEADIVISSTSSREPIITRELVKRAKKARKGRSLFLIDIAVPRDVEPSVNDLDNVFLYDVDDLSQIVAQSLEGRAAEAARAEAIVREEARGFEQWVRERAMKPAIVGLRAKARAILGAELERSLSGKLRHLTAADREALTTMLDAATNKLLHTPTTRLRALASDPRGADYADALRALFEIELEPEDHEPAARPVAAEASAATRPTMSSASEPSVSAPKESL